MQFILMTVWNFFFEETPFFFEETLLIDDEHRLWYSYKLIKKAILIVIGYHFIAYSSLII